jgi:phage-related protein
MQGVYEIRVNYDSDTYRTVYVINLGDDIYVLHVFQKKSKQGGKLSKEDSNTIQERLKRAKEIAYERKKEREKN